MLVITFCGSVVVVATIFATIFGLRHEMLSNNQTGTLQIMLLLAFPRSKCACAVLEIECGVCVTLEVANNFIDRFVQENFVQQS